MAPTISPIPTAKFSLFEISKTLWFVLKSVNFLRSILRIIHVETNCGGIMDIYLEPYRRNERLVIVGQGGRDEIAGLGYGGIFWNYNISNRGTNLKNSSNVRTH